MPRQVNEVLDSLILTDNKYYLNRVRENEALISSAALSIAYGGVFHSHINALTLFFKVRILDKHVGLISHCVLYRIEIDLLGIQSVGIATLNQS